MQSLSLRDLGIFFVASNRKQEDDMVKRSRFGWLSLAFILALASAPWTVSAAAPAANPAIVLAAFGTTGAATAA